MGRWPQRQDCRDCDRKAGRNRCTIKGQASVRGSERGKDEERERIGDLAEGKQEELKKMSEHVVPELASGQIRCFFSYPL